MPESGPYPGASRVYAKSIKESANRGESSSSASSASFSSEHSTTGLVATTPSRGSCSSSSTVILSSSSSSSYKGTSSFRSKTNSSEAVGLSFNTETSSGVHTAVAERTQLPSCMRRTPQSMMRTSDSPSAIRRWSSASSRRMSRTNREYGGRLHWISSGVIMKSHGMHMRDCRGQSWSLFRWLVPASVPVSSVRGGFQATAPLGISGSKAVTISIMTQPWS
ncbi:hypothetical protein BKA82DRAFT_1005085 [Pisolithus tinctorius]|uniref:Uncharacterized protein n=1 Tax=Pisolithus tinctorius Marx 270 TaxID=870435 RepID=A0A0C3IP49_PISTI|nr:hypothetical protein BKA82DRAFT_1005085 [Pisolithus tinctorius]KIN98742.1 hypothetical protein M404DRAFT_1005085 [Pisolithus tinctorius Marx 270]